MCVIATVAVFLVTLVFFAAIFWGGVEGANWMRAWYLALGGSH